MKNRLKVVTKVLMQGEVFGYMQRFYFLALIISSYGYSFSREDIKFKGNTNFKGTVINIFKLKEEDSNRQDIIFELKMGPNISLVDNRNYEVTKTRLDIPTEVGQKKLTTMMVLDQKLYQKPYSIKLFCD